MSPIPQQLARRVDRSANRRARDQRHAIRAYFALVCRHLTVSQIKAYAA